MQMIFAIAAGGAIGAVSRHWNSQPIARWLGHGFPFGTMSVNIAGSALLGVSLLSAGMHMARRVF